MWNCNGTHPPSTTRTTHLLAVSWKEKGVAVSRSENVDKALLLCRRRLAPRFNYELGIDALPLPLKNPKGHPSCRRRPPCLFTHSQPSTMKQGSASLHSRTPSTVSCGRKVACSPEADSDRSVDREFPLLPIDWAPPIKYLVLFQVVAHAGMASWCASAFIPAFLQMSQFFHQSISNMTYLVGSYTLMMGFGVLLWNPLADRYGRRPILLLSLSECLIATCGVAVSKSYTGIVVARVFQGLGVCAPLSLGAAYMKEMYPPRNRGTALGIWTLSITCGPFLAPFVCGQVVSSFRIQPSLLSGGHNVFRFIAHHSTWQWIVWLEALMLAGILLFEAVFLPEAIPGKPCFRNLYTLRDVLLQLPTEPNTITGDFFLTTRKTFAAVQYPTVWLAGLAFAVPYGCP